MQLIAHSKSSFVDRYLLWARRNCCSPDEVRNWLMHTAESLILDGADIFYFGGYGAFDSLAAAVLRELKKTYRHIQIVLVLAYLNRNVNATGYDSTLYPELENVPPRFAISRRNKWMVEMADVVVAYVTHDWGGAQRHWRVPKEREKQSSVFPRENTSAILCKEPLNILPFLNKKLVCSLFRM